MSLDCYHLYAEYGNSNWEIKWFAPFCSEHFRNYGLSFEAMHFSHFSVTLADLTRFSKVPVTFRARKAVYVSCVYIQDRGCNSFEGNTT